MARMYARRKGKSGSKRVKRDGKPDWLEYEAEDVKKIIIKHYKEGKTMAEVGLILRDVYGIPDVRLFGFRIKDVIKEAGLYPEYPEDLMALFRKAIRLRKHLEKHKKDYHTKRGLQLVESKIRRLADYYKSIGELPADWKYDPKQVELVVR